MAVRKKIRIGDLLVEHKVISEQQLMAALGDQKRSGRKLGQVLIENGYVEEKKFLDFLSRQLQVPYIDLKHFKFDKQAVQTLPETLARRYRALVLDNKGEDILIGMADPTDIFAYDDLAKQLKKALRLAIVREVDLLQTIDSVYRKTDEISSIAEELGEELSENDFDLAQLAQTDNLTDAPVVRLLQSLFDDAIQIKASDIHIEPDETVLRIRQRIDGVLQEQVMKEKRIANALVSRLKLMAGLDISEKRLPQDGRFNIRVKNKSIDVRVSTMPVQYGESVVMRLLDQSGGTLDLEQLGMPPELLKRYRTFIHRPHGMVLVTGPTGSGKTTTLYATLSELNNPETKIITVEDPVEYRLPRINQVQVNTKIGLTFASVLRSALRQDPDIVLIGEMRDQETAEIGLRSAMTGHFVLSTLHTNDAISTANRLIDMGAEGYLVATALQAVLAQRLVRKICTSCTETCSPDPHESAWLRSFGAENLLTTEFKKGIGCPHCNNTGYSGRIGIYELLEIDEMLADALRRNDSSDFARYTSKQPGFKTLAQNALEYAVQGITTIEEVIRIAGELENITEKEEVQITEEKTNENNTHTPIRH
ncbi:MAG: ATPase, T2SS/T4P/T4SS family [Gammaproteobacteria bacterium]|nr:ATPase, T2SS/T4P/T4SS family [Gammaproteobacteria bacterium]MDH5594779.1 ATPase, T2SS/T4P/T4SS family [Gammaproteobacteria bacterium]